jgi:deoxyribonucleoside regulator
MDEEKRDELTVKIARLYYLEDMNLRTISDKLNVSTATISRNLSRAKERRIVEIVIHESRNGNSSTEVAIEKTFGIRECIVTRSFEKRDNVFREMGEAMGPLLSRILKTGDVLGVSWGETLRAIAENLIVERPMEVNVIPVIGAMGEVENGIYPNAIAARFAQKIGGKNYLVNTPAVLDSPETKLSMEKDRNFFMVRQWWDQLSTAIVGVSDLSPAASLCRYGIFSGEELNQMRALDVGCTTNFNLTDRRGRPIACEIDKRMMKMSLEELDALRNLIVVATGKEKVSSLLAALSGGFVDVLVVDKDTADAILSRSADYS